MASGKYDEAEAAGMAAKMGANATEADIQNVADKMDGMNKGPLAKIWDKVTYLWKTFNSPKTPGYVKAIIIGGLIYMVSPIDLIPDVVPILGLTDDAGVLGVVFTQVVRLLGTAAVAGAVAATIIVVHGLLTQQRLKQEIKEKSKTPNAMSGKIEKMYKEGNYQKVTVGLFDENDNEVGNVEVQADSVSNDIYVGQRLLLNEVA